MTTRNADAIRRLVDRPAKLETGFCTDPKLEFAQAEAYTLRTHRADTDVNARRVKTRTEDSGDSLSVRWKANVHCQCLRKHGELFHNSANERCAQVNTSRSARE